MVEVTEKRKKRIATLIEPLRVGPARGRPGQGLRPGLPVRHRQEEGRPSNCCRPASTCSPTTRPGWPPRDTHGVLVCLQSLDAGGKDGTIRHVMSGVNPQGVRVSGFKVPSAAELDHDYLWRYARRLPARGEIGIFNRSHYEEVLVVRVHPEALARQKLPTTGEGRQDLGPPLPGDQRLGALPGRQRDHGREALPEPLQGGAADPLPQADRRARAELEVLRRRRPRTPAVGRLPGRLLPDAVGDQHRAGARGTSSRPTASGSPASAPARCWRTR